jgi:hypothetical protein
MKFHPSGLVVTAVFYGFLWYAFERGVDYGYMQALAVVALSVAAGWLFVGVIAQSPLGPRWPLRRARKVSEQNPNSAG